MKTLDQYLESKGITRADFNKKNPEEQSEIYNELNEINAKAYKELQEKVEKGEETKESLESALKELRDAQTEQMKSLNETLKAYGVQIKALSEKEKKEANNTGTLRSELEKHVENLKKMKNGGKSEAKEASFEFTVKAPGTMAISTNVSGGNIPVEDRIEGLNLVPSRPVRLLDVMAKRSTTSNVVSWVYQANKDGAAGQTAEAGAKNQIDFDLVVANETVKKTTAYIKVSTEMLDDIDYIESEIRGELMRELLKAVEAQAYSGDGTGNNHNGITTVASAFSVAGVPAAVTNANVVDVLSVAANQIKVAQEMGAMPNYIFMHPTDVMNLKLQKVSGTDKRYVERLIDVAGNLTMDGIPIIETTLVTVGDYLIGDFNLATLVTRQGVRIDIGLDGNDFTNNIRTILAEWRGLTIVKNNDQSAFVYGTIATDIAALEGIV